jgi:predicted ABC-type ATPase
MINQSKEAIIIAGPNGSGKSTLVSGLSHIFTDLVKVNPDDILKSMSLTESTEDYIIAFQAAEKLREQYLLDGKSFLLETVFSTQDKVDFVKKCKDHRYSVTIFYMATESPTINNMYVFDRVQKGGHAVPMNKLLERYYRSLENIQKVLEISDCVLFIDNSIMFEKPKLYTALSYGSPCYAYDGDKPEWLNKILNTISNNSFVYDEAKKAKCEFLQDQINDNFLDAVERSSHDALELNRDSDEPAETCYSSRRK